MDDSLSSAEIDMWRLQASHHTLSRQLQEVEHLLQRALHRHMEECKQHDPENTWKKKSPETMTGPQLHLALASSPLGTPAWTATEHLASACTVDGHRKILEFQRLAIQGNWYCVLCQRTLDCEHVVKSGSVQESKTPHIPEPPKLAPTPALALSQPSLFYPPPPFPMPSFPYMSFPFPHPSQFIPSPAPFYGYPTPFFPPSSFQAPAPNPTSPHSQSPISLMPLVPRQPEANVEPSDGPPVYSTRVAKGMNHRHGRQNQVALLSLSTDCLNPSKTTNRSK